MQDSITIQLHFPRGVVFRGVFGANEMILFLMLCNGPLRKHIKSFGTPCKTMIGLSERQTLSDLGKTRDVAYQDALKEFDSIWGSRRSYYDPKQLSCHLVG